MNKFIVSLALTLAMSAPALAEPLEAPTGTVSYADLDLSSMAGRIALQARLAQAINIICANPEPRDLALQHYVQQCRNVAQESVDRQLATLYANKKLAHN
jgi:UrcA family protein